MLLYLRCLLAGCVCGSVAGQRVTPDLEVKVLENRTAVLPCPDTGAGLTWSTFKGGTRRVLVTLTNGLIQITDERFGSQPNGSLVLTNVKESDGGMYQCNRKFVYLNVNTGSSGLVPKVPTEDKIPSKNNGVTEPEQRGTAAAGEPGPEPTPSSYSWKVPVGLLLGCALVVLVLVTLRFWSKRKSERKSSTNQVVTEAIYEEIGDDRVEPKTEPEDPGLCYSTIHYAPGPVDRTRTKTRSRECVYSLLQIPDQPGNS